MKESDDTVVVSLLGLLHVITVIAANAGAGTSLTRDLKLVAANFEYKKPRYAILAKHVFALRTNL